MLLITVFTGIVINQPSTQQDIKSEFPIALWFTLESASMVDDGVWKPPDSWSFDDQGNLEHATGVISKCIIGSPIGNYAIVCIPGNDWGFLQNEQILESLEIFDMIEFDVSGYSQDHRRWTLENAKHIGKLSGLKKCSKCGEQGGVKKFTRPRYIDESITSCKICSRKAESEPEPGRSGKKKRRREGRRRKPPRRGTETPSVPDAKDKQADFSEPVELSDSIAIQDMMADFSEIDGFFSLKGPHLLEKVRFLPGFGPDSARKPRLLKILVIREGSTSITPEDILHHLSENVTPTMPVPSYHKHLLILETGEISDFSYFREAGIEISNISNKLSSYYDDEMVSILFNQDTHGGENLEPRFRKLRTFLKSLKKPGNIEPHPHDEEKFQSTFDTYGHGEGNGKSQYKILKHHKKCEVESEKVNLYICSKASATSPYLFSYGGEDPGERLDLRRAKNLAKEAILNTISILSFMRIIKFEKEEQWTIIADETGKWADFPSLDIRNVLMWVIIPPNSQMSTIPIPRPDFHSISHLTQTKDLLKILIEEANRNLHIICFEAKENPVSTSISSESGLSSDPVVSTLNATLPLVLEYVRNQIKGSGNSESSSVSIFAERRKDMVSGSAALASSVNEITLPWDGRIEGKVFDIPEVKVLDKFPMEDPYLAFPDVIGQVFHPQEKKSLTIRELVKELKLTRNFHHLDTSPSSLSSLKSIMKDVSNPEKFLTSLYTLPSNDFTEYSRHFLQGAISEAVLSLGNSQLDRVLKKMKSVAEDPSSTAVTDEIFSTFVKEFPESRLEDSLYLKLDYNIANLGRLNHTSASNQAEGTINRIEAIIDQMHLEGLKPPMHRVEKYRTLCLVHGQNSFDFHSLEGIMSSEGKTPDFSSSTVSELRGIAREGGIRGYSKLRKAELSELIADSLDFSSKILQSIEKDDSVPPSESRSKLGATALTLALRGDFTQAKAIEDYLWKQELPEDRSRRLVNRIELELEISGPSVAINTFLEEAPKLCVESGMGAFLEREPYMLCAFLKSISEFEGPYGTKVREELSSIASSLSEKSLMPRKQHPYQRVCYWFLKAVARDRRNNDAPIFTDSNQTLSLSESCQSFLKELSEEDYWSRGALAVILSCELMDLKSSGEYPALKSIEPFGLLNGAIEHPDAADSLIEWVKANWPNEEDWLRPLKFNYR